MQSVSEHSGSLLCFPADDRWLLGGDCTARVQKVSVVQACSSG